MKQIIITILISISFLGFAQENTKFNKDKKVFLGLHYIGNVGDKGIINYGYKGIIGLDARCAFLNRKNIDFQAGSSFDYLNPKNNFFPKSIIIINPNVGINYNIPNSIFCPYFNIGYGFFSYKTNISDIQPQDQNNPELQNINIKQKFSGFTANPGFKLYFSKRLFFDINYKYFGVNNKDFPNLVNTHYFNLGFGVKI